MKKILENTLAALSKKYFEEMTAAMLACENGRLLELKIENEESPCDPRDKDFYDNLGTLICDHKNYRLGDTAPFSIKECSSWQEVKAKIENFHEN